MAEALRKCKNLQQIVLDNETTITECYASIEQQEQKLIEAIKLREQQEKEFADVRVTLEKSVQLERNCRLSTTVKLHQAIGNIERLEKVNQEADERSRNDQQKIKELERTLQEVEARHKIELERANDQIMMLQVEQALPHTSGAPAANVHHPPIQRSQPQQQQQRQVQQELPPDFDLLAEAIDFADLSQFVVSRVPAEASKRTKNVGAAASATKRLRTRPEFQHLTTDEYESLVAANLDCSKLPNVDAAWKALDWAIGLCEKNAGDINKPPDALKLVIVDHSKEQAGLQRTSPFEEWLMLVLKRLSETNKTMNKRNIFLKLTGRSNNAYQVLLKRYK